MSMPGFTADVTIYSARENYRGAFAREGVGRIDVVIPQLPISCARALNAAFDVCDTFGMRSEECEGAIQLVRAICRF
jgi:hypothetical protein